MSAVGFDTRYLGDNGKQHFGNGRDMTISYDGSTGQISTADVAPSDLDLNCGTDKTLRLVEPVWQDLDFPIIIRTTGVGIPTLEALLGDITAPQWQVNDFNVCEGQEIPHIWKEGTSLYFHVHLVTNGAELSAKYVRFELQYAWANVAGQATQGTTITTADLEIPANTPDKSMLLLSIGTVTLAGAKIRSHVWPRLKRVAASGAAPAANPWITMLQAHIECDTLGSRQIGTK